MFQCKKKKSRIPIKKKSSTKKKSIDTLEQEVFLESLKNMISELIPNCPREILIELRTYLNNLFIKMKDQFDTYYGEKYTVKERNKVWEIIAKKYLTIFQPFIDLLNKESNHNYDLVSLQIFQKNLTILWH